MFKKFLSSKSEREIFDEQYRDALDDTGKIMFVGCLLERASRLYAENVALICQDRSMTYKELYQRASMVSQKLHEYNVQPHSHVLLIFENSIEFYIGYFGILQTGAVVIPVNTLLHEKELAHVFKDSQPVALVAHSKFVEKYQSVNGEIPSCITENDIDLSVPVPDDFSPGALVCLEPDELAVMLYTSGTTGVPKGVMLSSKNIMTNVVQTIAAFHFSDCHRLFAVLPLFHSFAQNTCVWSVMFAGCTAIVVPKIERSAILTGLKHKPTVVLGVPALYGLLCLFKTAPLEGVDFFVSAGDALPDKIRNYFSLLYRRKISSGYGLTETSPMISVEIEDITLPSNVVGKPAIGIAISIRDDEGNELPQGRIGVLWVKGDNVMLGYYNAPEATAEVLQNGWFCTGDLVLLDEQGRIAIVGRQKDLIINKGLNIYPQEIENIILTNSQVLRAAVIGKPEEGVGEVPIAFFSLRDKTADPGIVEQELRQQCGDNLASYKVPKKFICLEELPLTSTSKVDKSALKKQEL